MNKQMEIELKHSLSKFEKEKVLRYTSIYLCVGDIDINELRLNYNVFHVEHSKQLTDYIIKATTSNIYEQLMGHNKKNIIFIDNISILDKSIKNSILSMLKNQNMRDIPVVISSYFMDIFENTILKKINLIMKQEESKTIENSEVENVSYEIMKIQLYTRCLKDIQNKRIGKYF